MKDNKGQALVEFILILPIFILILITMVDFGNIMLKKYSLENDLDVISDMYKKSDYDNLNNYINEKNIKVNYDREDEFIKINVSRNIDIISPILIPIMGNPYTISSSGVYYE